MAKTQIAKRMTKKAAESVALQVDARNVEGALAPGVTVAVQWFDDPDYYLGTVEASEDNGELVMQLPHDTLGQLEIAYHVVKM